MRHTLKDSVAVVTLDTYSTNHVSVSHSRGQIWSCGVVLCIDFGIYKCIIFMSSLKQSKRFRKQGRSKTPETPSAPLNAVTTAFVGLHQVVSEYRQPNFKFQQTAQDDLDGEREALIEDSVTDKEDEGDAGFSDGEGEEDSGDEEEPHLVPSSASAEASTRDADGDTVMAEAGPSKLNVSIVKEFSKGVGDRTLAGYRSLMNQLEQWVHKHNLISEDEKFFRAEPHEDSPDMISAWIMDACDLIKLDGTESRKSWSHAQKMRAAATFGFGRLHGLGSLTWHRSEVSGKMVGNPSVSQQVSMYMVSLHRRKIDAGEEATSARAITAQILKRMYNFNTRSENWDPQPSHIKQSLSSSSSTDPHSHTRLKNAGRKNHLGPRFRRLLHLAYTIAFACLLRVDEVLNITFDQIELEEDDDGTMLMIITLSKRKTAQFGEILPFVLRQLPEHQRHLCPVRAYAEWIDALNEEDGYVFRRMKKDRTGPLDQAMTSQQFLEGLRHNLLDVNIDPAPYGTHSFRRGGCQWLSMDLRWPFTKICQWGGWSTELTHSTIVRYLVSWNDEPTHQATATHTRPNPFYSYELNTLEVWKILGKHAFSRPHLQHLLPVQPIPTPSELSYQRHQYGERRIIFKGWFTIQRHILMVMYMIARQSSQPMTSLTINAAVFSPSTILMRNTILNILYCTYSSLDREIQPMTQMIDKIRKLLKQHRKTRCLADVALERGFISNFGTTRTFTIGIDISPLLCSYAAKKASLGQAVINSPTDLTLSQFFRFITQLSQATVNCIFVFDGKGRPKKKRGRRVLTRHLPVSHNDAKSFIVAGGFHHHTAPGEADAELAEMNRRDMIDMIISPDSDLFALGASCIAQINSAESKEFDELIVDIYYVHEICQAMALSRERFILYALIAGNDLDDGVDSCGPQTAMKAAESWAMPFLSRYQLLSSGQQVAECLTDLKMEVINILAEKAPAKAKKVQASVFPQREALDAFAKPLTSWTNSHTGPIDAASWVPSIQDIRALTECCRVHLRWDDEEILNKFVRMVYPGAVIQILCSKQVYYDYQDGTLLAARVNATASRRVANRTLLMNPKPKLPLRILDPRLIDPQESVAACFSVIHFTSEVLITLGRGQTIQSAAIELQIPMVLLFAATHPSRYGRLIRAPSVDVEVVSISDASDHDDGGQAKEASNSGVALETSGDDSVDSEIEFGEISQASNFIDLTLD
ncbi:hypothetical protein VNI00_005397 [Paramarasmius palmivorus]|uniref:XPG-I domain-containing protein n=1 Tax=Paramarasmius palmivorus TaxID=297713 RepID=A0AAW0DFB9_9AGAR